MTQFPPSEEKDRIHRYQANRQLFFGNHGDGLAGYLQNHGKEFSNGTLRLLSIPFAGMISTVSADLLFEQFPKVTTENNNQFIEALKTKNNLEVQFYESALSGSYAGDVVFRVRVENEEVIVEDVNPEVYFPEYDATNVRREPTAHNIMYKVPLGTDVNHHPREGVLQERHTAGLIEYRLWLLDANSDQIVKELDLAEYDPELPLRVDTNIDKPLVIHIKNHGVNSSRFGVSDYHDLYDLMYAIDNRISRTESILDRHGDPILTVPPGILDETGQVAREQMGVIEMGMDAQGNSTDKPEYIVWDAKLESSFQQLETYIDQLLTFAQISPAILGRDNAGQAESGRALKFKMLRTLSMKNRKQKYFENGMKQIFQTAQELAKKNGYTANGVVSADPEEVQIEWPETYTSDEHEETQLEVMKVNNGLSSNARSIARLEDITVEEAKERVEENQLNEQEKQQQGPNLNI